MLPILDRVMLWTDKEKIEEILQLDPVNSVFLTGLRRLCYGNDALKIFNEVFYQLTRMVYERPLPQDLPRYEDMVKNSMGGDKYIDVVMSMCYFLILLFNKYRLTFNIYFVDDIKITYEKSSAWRIFRTCYHILRNRGINVSYYFEPKPCNADDLKDVFIDWNTITCNYELSSIDHVLSLWPEGEQRRTIALMIEESIGGAATRKKVKSDLVILRNYFRKYHDNEDDLSLSIEERLRIALLKLQASNTPSQKMLTIEEAESMVEENLINLVNCAIKLGTEETKMLDHILRKKYWGTDKYPKLFNLLTEYIDHPEKRNEIFIALEEMVDALRRGYNLNIGSIILDNHGNINQ